ncbi:hypothetical protein P7H75_14225 [Vagococcus carniphilus]|uniref:hypothetical protein n=1 Tax=Vagococcus carniphilus TaxID=218144 RepID=UPI00289174DC|nr:hypothetical protein [Vagococcus carniphilus]MDT2816013.1 hypothetical protein [Vagococcus carniphilus]
MSTLSAEELKNKEIGYIRDNRHFFNVPLTKRNIKEFVPSKEKRELTLIQMELAVCGFNSDFFQVIGIREIKMKYKSYYVYILMDSRNNKGCGVFVLEHEVVCIHLKGYKFTDPLKKDWICTDVTEAIKKTGKVNNLIIK